MSTLAEQWPSGTRVTKPGFGYRGIVVRVERKYRTDWVVVSWEGRQFTARENPSMLKRVTG